MSELHDPRPMLISDFPFRLDQEGIVIARDNGVIKMFAGDCEFTVETDAFDFDLSCARWSEPFDRPENRAVAYGLLVSFRAWVIAVPRGYRPSPQAAELILDRLEKAAEGVVR